MRINNWFKSPFLWLWLLTTLFASPTLGQEYLVSVQHYSVPQGLSDRGSRYTIQDRKGFIWVATSDGLNRFDGFEFQQYTTEKNGLSTNRYEQMIEDRRGQLWLISSRQFIQDDESTGIRLIDLFDPITGLATAFEEAFSTPFAAKDISGLQSDWSGTIYILLTSGQIYSYNGFAFNLLFKVALEGKGQLAVSNEELIGLLNGNQVTQFDSLGQVLYQTSLPAPGDFIRAANGQFLVGKKIDDVGSTMWSIRADQAAQPFYFMDKNGQPVSYDSNDNLEPFVYPDREGRWWFYGNGRLLLVDATGKFLHDFSADLEEFEIPFLFYGSFDSRNTAWINSGQGLVSISIQKNPFTNYLTSKYLRDTRGITSDKKGQVYAVQQGKTWLLDGNSSAATELGVPAWLAASRDARDNLWFGDYSPKVFFYNRASGEQKIFYPPSDSGKVHSISTRVIFPDPKTGRIWVGTQQKGLAYIDTLKEVILPFTAYNEFQQLQHASINCMLDDESGLWLGTNLGLYLLHPEKGVVAGYSRQTGDLPFDDIYHVYKDQEGVFWLATSGGGLIRWDRNRATYRQFTRKDGLSNDVIYAVYEDELEHLWLPSNYGLMRFNKHNFEVNTYQPRDGIPHEEFNFSSHFQAPDGRLYFGGLKGVTAFYPKDPYQPQPATVPALGVSQYLELDGATGAFVDKTKELLSTNKIRLAPRNKSFILKIAFPDYQSPKDNRFAYRIEGLYQDWIYQPDNTIRVNSLPYGAFTLHIKAQGVNGNWVNKELSLPLTVVRPFYLRWWFLAICITMVSFLIWWRIRMLKQAAIKLESEVKKRTQQIEQDKQFIEKQAAELLQLDELKSRFFANMAHELRTPLTLILSPLKRLLKEEDLNNRSFTTLKLIESNAKSLLRMSEEILDMDKLEAHQLELQEETVAFYPLMRRLVSTFESHAQANDIELQFDYHAEQYLQLKLDINKLERILFNLISNALKFTARNGKVAITVADNAGSIHIRVADTGRGIHPDDLPHIFDRFYQAKFQGEQAEGGAGIGLAIAREYAQILGGTLRAESQLNEGSTFAFQFPKKEVFRIQDIPPAYLEPYSELVATKNESPPEINNQRPTILVVEDNSDMRRFLQEILSPHYQVLTARNGTEALSLLKREPQPPTTQLPTDKLPTTQLPTDQPPTTQLPTPQPPTTQLPTDPLPTDPLPTDNSRQLPTDQPPMTNDQLPIPNLIITDLMMPEMDGYSLLKVLKKEPLWQSLPVIVLTARASLADRLTALRIGVDDYLAKPFDTEELLARAANLIQNYQARLDWHQKQAAKPKSQTDEKTHFPNLSQLLQSKELQSIDQQWLEKVEEIAFQKIGPTHFSAEDLAKELSLSSRQLRRKLKQFTGMTPTDYLREIRLQKARLLLEKKAAASTTEACYAIGLSDIKHFSKVFYQRFGKKPSDYLNDN